ncbi:MAG: nucleotide exchange factor GrpE [Bacillota bacterium]|uniref:nucleotide exchange factor GrpE n=1 Tax=Desulfurispora thermophila TaxID=265470 RepID=UPI00035C98DF|nr:nucleotide exchange factor GrpE [Desulfurispora thermophila]
MAEQNISPDTSAGPDVAGSGNTLDDVGLEQQSGREADLSGSGRGQEESKPGTEEQVGEPEGEKEDHSPAGDAPPEQVDLAGLQAELAQKTALAEEYFQRLARLQADFDNYRKRTLREKEELLKFAAEKLIGQLLPVLDNFERALAAPEGDGAAFRSGVEMIYRQLMDILNREGLEPLQCVGQPFDPARHEAVMRQPAGERPENTVLAELQKGYILHGKVIRPAMVCVACQE